ncbi:hypothetical protein [Corynebacterium sp. NML120713]|uniref:hypothetical protein n=1 Tax=Corynebacterium sp. NML120713 TaxID=1906332 RepID=UPI000AD0C936|nr:hypothetical protein [Corynebacterium sp. NML120713]
MHPLTDRAVEVISAGLSSSLPLINQGTHQIFEAIRNPLGIELPISDAQTTNSANEILQPDSVAEMCALINDAAICLSETVGDIESRNKILAGRNTVIEWLADYLVTHPDERISVSDRVQATSKRTFPWNAVQPPARGLAMLYNFSPFQDTGATVASKRLRDFGTTVDVIACSFLHRKKVDNTIEAIAEPYVASRYFLPMAPSWASWGPFRGFAVKATEFASQKMENGANYEFLYSRAMWAPSIYAGALFKSRYPSVKWIAEFSDPLSLDVEGLPRGGSVPRDELSEFYFQLVSEEYPELAYDSMTVFSLAEYLVYTQADEIYFTNENQMKTMLEQVPSQRLRERVQNRAIVSNHPTLPRSYYLHETSEYAVDNDVLNLGYFGEFYSSRSITEVTAAMRTLPEALKQRVHLHVFTNYIPASEGNQRPRGFSKKRYDELVNRAYEGVGASGIEDHVTFNPSLPYLKFLATTEKLDYLIVNDARSGDHHSRNPYLPSKWSDYAGSSAKTWAFIEEGSILSGKPADIKTPVGDVASARTQLWDMILRKFPDLTAKFEEE